MSDFKVDPFNPPFGIRGPHSQTLWGFVTRRPTDVTLRRERLELPDGDFIDIDFGDAPGLSWAQLGSDAPIVLLLHGLEGSADSAYAQRFYSALAQLGIRPVGMNYRSCSGEMNRLPRMYHGGATEDIYVVHDYLREQYGDVPFGMVGISLGGNLTLKYLGENDGARSGLVQRAVAISSSFDFGMCVDVLDRGVSQVYGRRMLQSLQKKVQEKRALLEPLIDVEAALRATNFRTFDDVQTAPLFGYVDADDLYRHISSGQFLPTIKTETLILRAYDDPFFDPADILWSVINRSPYLTNGIVRQGGHVGFAMNYRGDSWAEAQAVRFLSSLVEDL